MPFLTERLAQAVRTACTDGCAASCDGTHDPHDARNWRHWHAWHTRKPWMACNPPVYSACGGKGCVAYDDVPAWTAAFRTASTMTICCASKPPSPWATPADVAMADSLRHMSELVSLQFACCSLELVELCLKHVPQLTCLTLDNCRLHGAMIGSMLGYVPQLRTFRVFDCGLGQLASEAVARYLACVPELTELDVSGYLSDDNVVALTAGLAHTPNLTRLRLAWNGIGSGGVRAICSAAERLPALRELDLEHNRIDAACVEPLSNLCDTARRLRHVWLAGNCLQCSAHVYVSL